MLPSRRRSFRFSCVCSAALVAAITQVRPVHAGHMEFTPGAVYVTIAGGSPKGCMKSDAPDTIWEYNPATDQWRLFAATPPEWGCSSFGALTFTPDGSGLRAAAAGGGFARIVEFDADGNMSVVVPDSFGGWSTGMLYDRDQNFFYSPPYNVFRIPAEGGPAELFADRDDGTRFTSFLAAPTDGTIY